MSDQSMTDRHTQSFHSFAVHWLALYRQGTLGMPIYILGTHTTLMARCILQGRRALHSVGIKVHPFVKEALDNRRPVVALESTIITHGMPYPQNLSTAKEVEEIVRMNGAVPATIGILNGCIHVGLQNDELECLAKRKNVVKVSRRDFPYVLSKGMSGGTTVAGTIIVAHKAGIPIFVTGGIGGVHRGGEKTLDVSADLTELGRTPVAVISAGIKSILDIGRTLEYLASMKWKKETGNGNRLRDRGLVDLVPNVSPASVAGIFRGVSQREETQGVCVAAFGESREFPAFFSRQSGFQAPHKVQNEEDAAKLIARSLALQLGSGVLIAVPCPEEEAVSGQLIEEAIQQALREARPQLDIALIKNNAIVGSRIAVALNKIQRTQGRRDGTSPSEKAFSAPRPVVIGGINVDFIAKVKTSVMVERPAETSVSMQKEERETMATERKGRGVRGQLPGSDKERIYNGRKPGCSALMFLKQWLLQQGAILCVVVADVTAEAFAKEGGQTNPSTVRQTFGGVGRNLADCLSRLGKTPVFISAMGKDEHSEAVLRSCRHMDMSGVSQLDGHNTATYCLVVASSGEVRLGLGDMEIHQQITEQYVSGFKESLCQAPLICIDGNVPVSTIQYICHFARERRLAVYYEPTDVDKASGPFFSDCWRSLACISPNLRELRAINRTLGHPVPADLPSKLEDVVETAVSLVLPLLRELHCVVVTLGHHGVLVCGRSVGGSVSLHPGLCSKTTASELCATHYPAIPVPVEELVNVSGAGDSLMAGIIAGLLAGEDTNDCVRMGLLSASLSLRSYEPISPAISATSVNVERVQAQRWLGTKTWKLS